VVSVQYTHHHYRPRRRRRQGYGRLPSWWIAVLILVAAFLIHLIVCKGFAQKHPEQLVPEVSPWTSC
jgi:hypothetical protein